MDIHPICRIKGHAMRDPAPRADWSFQGPDPLPTLACRTCGYRRKTLRLASGITAEDRLHDPLIERGSLLGAIFSWVIAALICVGIPLGFGLLASSVAVGIFTALILGFVLVETLGGDN